MKTEESMSSFKPEASTAPTLILQLRASRALSISRYKVVIWILTFLAYTSYHLSRRPISVVKNALHKNCSAESSNSSCGWAPFDNNSTYKGFEGALDSSYLASYAVGMFLSGHIAERMNLRYFLAAGMTLSALMTAMFGFGYLWGVHYLAYFVVVQILCGLVQSSGWPGVVACMGNWFGKGRRGLIMAIWNSHTSVGNILGAVIAGVFLDGVWQDRGYWAWSFIVPAAIILFMAFIVFLFLVPHPEDIDLPDPNKSLQVSESSPLINDQDNDGEPKKAGYGSTNNDSSDMSVTVPHHDRVKAVTLLGALKVPGVIEFSLCLFFAKLVSYTFLYWLPTYIDQSMKVSDSDAAYLATIFDVGGIAGGIATGFLADYTQSSAIICAIMLFLASPAMVVYRTYGGASYGQAAGLLLLAGAITNGPYCLITTSVSADLGTHPSLAGNAKALATVTAVIDGTGSIGAALGPALTAIIESVKSQSFNEDSNRVFGMLIASNICALLLLSRLVYKETLKIRQRRRAAA